MNIIDSLAELNLAAGAESYSTYSSIDSLINSNKFYVIKDANIYQPSNVIEFSKYIDTTTALTGGSKVASNIVSLEAAEGGAVTASSVGATTALPLSYVIGGALAGVGLGVSAFTISPEFWTNISNKIFGTDIAYSDINNYSIKSLYYNNAFYVPREIIDLITESLFEQNVFDKTYSYDGPKKDGYFTFIPSGFSSGYARQAISYALAHYTDPYAKAALIHLSSNLSSAYSNFISNVDINNYDYLRVSVGTRDSGASVLASITLDAVRLSNYTLSVSESTDFAGEIYYEAIGGASYAEREYYATINKYVGLYTPNTLYFDNNIGVFSGFFKYDFGGCIVQALNSKEIIEVPGISIQEDATIPEEGTPIPIEFPDWDSRKIEIGGYDDNESSIVKTPYYPLTIPASDPLTEGVSSPQEEAQKGISSEKVIDDQVIPNLPIVIPNPPADPPSSNEGDTPMPVIPPIPSQGISGALFTVYHPTQEQLRSLANVLWSTDLITQIKSIFQNPMDGVISLMSLYATPTDGNAGNIILGTIDSGVSSAVVTAQYIDIDCGNVRIPEIYGDATDYSPYVNVTIFLPFIGMRSLNTNEIIASIVNIKYRIDVLTGTCLASVRVTKDNSNAILYTFEGNCGIELPLTGADRSRLMSGMLSFAGGIAGASAGTLAPAVAGIAMTGGVISASHVSVDRSGSFSGNGGAMGNKKPYIIVTRTIPYTASNYNNLYGYPSNVRTTLNSLSGYTRIKDVKTSGIPNATDEEKIMIERILKEGVYI